MSHEPLVGKEEYNAVKAVLKSRQLSCYRASDIESKGKVRELEDAFCEYFKVKFAVAMNSATSCLHCACYACGVKGGKAIVPVVTFSATASAVLHAGGTPLFCDIEAGTYSLDLNNLNYRAEIIIPVHLHGHPANMKPILSYAHQYHLRVVEDASQALGAMYEGKLVGTLGRCGIFSLNQWKPITCGEGGILITDDSIIANICRLMRNHGETVSNILGYNYRLTELQAAVALEQFRKLDKIILRKIELGNYLTEKLKGIEGIIPPAVVPGCTHIYYTYPIRVSRAIGRDWLQDKLFKQGIYFGQGGYKPLHYFPYYSQFIKGTYPVAEECFETVMFTDIIRPQATFKDMNTIAQTIKELIYERTHS